MASATVGTRRVVAELGTPVSVQPALINIYIKSMTKTINVAAEFPYKLCRGLWTNIDHAHNPIGVCILIIHQGN